MAEYFGFTVKPHITLLGIGMGSQETLTVQGKKAAKPDADYVRFISFKGLESHT